MRIAAWSGPRNLSTAMMYSFAARPDCTALDEPLYAAFLSRSGLAHPMRAEVLAAQPTDPAEVARGLAAKGDRHVYQKHMAHHMEGMPLGWAEGCVHLHLIRHPARVIASYADRHDALTEDAIGFGAQAALYDRLGGIVLDTSALRADPDGMLRAVCAAIGLPWDAAMLAWAPGPKPFDGVWARHWYGSVHRSTGFAGPGGPLPRVARDDLLRAAMPAYEALAARALGPAHRSS